MNILVTGGAGFIGSHTVRLLLNKKYKIIILDNLSKGHKKSILKDVKFHKTDLADKNNIKKIFQENKIDAVMHFAGYIEAEESMKRPKDFYRNNVVTTINLLDVMLEFNVKNLIFSSSAAIFGIPKNIPVDEDAEKNPFNVYGTTKLIVEKILNDYDFTYGLKSICLRYFNAAGAGYGIGEDHNPETHLIPLVLKVALGKNKKIQIFGTDYPTKDGTCIRDYIHVLDLADAHILALQRLLKTKKSEQYNLGSEQGYSVREIIEIAREITNKKILVAEAKRRVGDIPILIADSSKIKKELGWNPKFALRDIIKSAWEWHKNNPGGFK